MTAFLSYFADVVEIAEFVQAFDDILDPESA